jgi:predicted dehydrogenase
MAAEFDVPPDGLFSDWHTFLAQPRACDAVVVATPDREHAGPAFAALQRGYDLLLEKPMGATLAECRAIAEAQRATGRIVGVCHSLRYQKGFRRLKDVVAGGRIGRVVSLDQVERVTFWHQAHSYVRGNWANESRSSFMLLAKSCHDLDYIAYLVDQPCLRVSSAGALTYFRAENAPAGSAARCTDDCPCEPSCPYSAIRQYVHSPRDRWPGSVVSADHSTDAHMEAIRTGPYGRCVWKCDNDAVDHQVVQLEFGGDTTATFTMVAFTATGGRRVRVYGTLGELEFDEQRLVVRTFADRATETIEFEPEPGGHGGGDTRVFQEWLTALHSRDTRGIVADARESLRTHTIVFAAERARREQRTVEIAEM